MQGRLRNEYLTVEVESDCAHCGQKLHFVLDSDLNGSVQEAHAEPLLFEPDVDWRNFTKPTIIDDY